VPNYLQDPTKCYYPYEIEKHLKTASEAELKLISKDINQAKELILLFSSNLVSTQFDYLKGNGYKVKNLYGGILLKQCGKNYKRIIDYLKKHKLLNTDNQYIVGVKSKTYWLSEKVIISKVKEHDFTNNTIINRRQGINSDFKKVVASNIISKISVEKVFPLLELPNVNQVQSHLESLANSKFTSKKGRLYKLPNNKRRERSLEGSNVTYTDDIMIIYKYLTKGGIKLYSTGNKNCPRPVSSITLIPKVIRDLITMNGQKLVEVDFSALHPNIANHLYGINKKMITHQEMADYFNYSEDELFKAKKLNLSYFNYEEKHFLNSKASKFYKEKHPGLYDELLRIKQIDPKQITYALFRKEVELMTRVFIELDWHGILPVYVYDAVLVIEKNAEKTKEVMDIIAKQMGVYTVAEVSK